MAKGKPVLMQKQRTKILLYLLVVCMNESHVFSNSPFHGGKIYKQLYYSTALVKFIIYSCMPPLKAVELCVKITTDDRE